MIRRPHFAFDWGQRTLYEPKFILSLPTCGANLIPTLAIPRAVTLDILWQSMQRKVRRSEGKEMEERPVAMLLLMLLEHGDRVIGNRIGRVKVRTDWRGRLALVIEEMKLQSKEAVVINVIRTIKATS